MVNFKRNINLKMLNGVSLSVEEKNYILAIKFLKEQTRGLNSYTSGDFSNFVFYGKSKENIIFDYDIAEKIFCVSHHDISLVLQKQFMIEKDNIKELIQGYVINILNIDDVSKINYAGKYDIKLYKLK